MPTIAEPSPSARIRAARSWSPPISRISGVRTPRAATATGPIRAPSRGHRQRTSAAGTATSIMKPSCTSGIIQG